MSYIVLNCITNWESNPKAAEDFENLLDSLKDQLSSLLRPIKETNDLKKIYIQFQYDCIDSPSAVKGIKISRYSKKHNDIQAYIEVTKDQFDNISEKERKELFEQNVLKILKLIFAKLDGKIESSVSELVALLEEKM